MVSRVNAIPIVLIYSATQRESVRTEHAPGPPTPKNFELSHHPVSLITLPSSNLYKPSPSLSSSFTSPDSLPMLRS